jgi:hypothetical protein
MTVLLVLHGIPCGLTVVMANLFMTVADRGAGRVAADVVHSNRSDAVVRRWRRHAALSGFPVLDVWLRAQIGFVDLPWPRQVALSFQRAGISASFFSAPVPTI